MKKRLAALFLAAASVIATPALADVYNLKVVTDANPDYSDMKSLVHSITSRWDKNQDKAWAVFYWNHIARRQTNPIFIHGMALTDPIRQFNDYGFTMCSTISGVNCGIWQEMGWKVRYNDVASHTVPEVFYDDNWHMYDNSLSAIYTTCDGSRIASLPELGAEGSCALSGGKIEPGHLVKYHCLNASSNNGFLEGADTNRDLAHLGDQTFNPKYIKFRYYYNDSERGHRYILNLRDGEVYTRTYSHPDELKKGANDKYQNGDPDYYVTNYVWDESKKSTWSADPERSNPRYHIRANGERVYTPAMKLAALHAASNLSEAAGALVANGNGEAVFKVEGANVITSLKLEGETTGKTTLAFSTTNGLTWAELPTSEDGKLSAKLRDEVNGQYEVLFKVGLADGASLKSIKFDTITEINSKTQPQLKLGANTVYVGAGEQTESIVIFPELQADKYKPFAVESVDVRTDEHHEGWHGVMGPVKGKDEGYVVYKIDAPQDIVRISQQARMQVKAPKSEIRFEHSFDDGKTWIKSYTFNDNEKPFDDFHDEIIKDVPAGTKSVLVKYIMNKASLYSVRMEVNHKVVNPVAGPVEVTFNWAEKGEDYKLTERSYTQLVDKLPTTFKIDVGGFDQPVVKSLTVNPKGARGELKYGYSDGKDVGGEKFVGQWMTYGKNLAEGKPYTATVKSDTQWGAGENEDKILTDGVVYASYPAGLAFKYGVLYDKGTKPEVTIDLGSTQKFEAVRAQIQGYPGADAIRGEIKDKIEVLTSNDGKDFKSQGEFDFRMYWKNVPVNFMYADDENFACHNHTLKFKEPIEARYVKFNITPARQKLGVTELQVIDKVESKPFDLKIALPGDATSTAQAAK
jgi:hypothetical protein